MGLFVQTKYPDRKHIVHLDAVLELSVLEQLAAAHAERGVVQVVDVLSPYTGAQKEQHQGQIEQMTLGHAASWFGSVEGFTKCVSALMVQGQRYAPHSPKVSWIEA
jgi:hypothetical protein